MAARRWIPVTLALTACAVPGDQPPPAPDAARTILTMGTTCDVVGVGPGANAALERAVTRILAAERRWSSWDPASLTSAIHRSPKDHPVAIDAAMARGLALADRWTRRTQGAFSPWIGRLLEDWGVARGGRPTVPAPTPAPPEPFHLAGRTLTRLHDDARLAEGGFVKGLALDAALAAGRAGAPALRRLDLDLGGQLAWWSKDPGSPARTAHVAHPRHRDRPVLALVLPPSGSLATSGNSERAIRIAGTRRSHILDPRSGQPCPDWGSVTVLTTAQPDGDALVADSLSTALFVLGPEAGLALARRLPGVEALFLECTPAGLRRHMTPGMRARVLSSERP